MKVLLALRTDGLRRVGGDTIQVLRTKDALERLGLEVKITTDVNAPLRGYDLVHLFNLLRVHETFWFAWRAQRLGIPTVLSPIYWELDGLEERWQGLAVRIALRLLGRDRTERLKTLVRMTMRGEWNRAALAQVILGYLRQQRLVVEWIRCLLPNSEGERDVLLRKFGALKKKCVVVPNAADPVFTQGDGKRFERRYGLRDFVLCVGRFDPRKNQLGLLKSLRGLSLPLVLVGGVHPNHRAYYNRVMAAVREARGRVLLLGPMGQQELADVYSAAKVHVQPSWVETPGLASLEAGLAGCNVVVTTSGPTREYFGDYAWYCDPWDPASIRSAVIAAYESERRLGLREHILRNYTWERAGALTLRAYRDVVR